MGAPSPWWQFRTGAHTKQTLYGDVLTKPIPSTDLCVMTGQYTNKNSQEHFCYTRDQNL